jgi:4-amino-4-deoxy-L-arabinose transferase-like glycosyltransferase
LSSAPLSEDPPGLIPRGLDKRRLLLALLILAFLRGLLYLAVMPPWQHYDEPTHFEYVRLIAERRALPQPGDYDLAMRREIAASMQVHSFWGDTPLPLPLWSDTSPELGISELEHPPLYYSLLALPQMLIAQQSVETQLYLARFVSVLFYLLAVAATYGLTSELLPARRWLPLTVSCFVALLPPFTDLGSSVNNDVGVAAITTCLLWSSVRLLRRGPALGRVVVTLLLAGAGLAIKSTSGLIAVAILLALVAAYVHSARLLGAQIRRRWVWIGLVLLVPVLLLVGFTWGRQAAHWYGEPALTRNSLGEADAGFEAPIGSRMLVLLPGNEPRPQSNSQELRLQAAQELQGKVVTFGAWLKSDEGKTGSASLGVYDGVEFQWHSVQVTPEWHFHAFSSSIRPDAAGVSVQIRLPGQGVGTGPLYVDGIVLVEGEMPLGAPPAFGNRQATEGEWGGRAFVNLLQNGSAERTWPSLRPWIGSREIYRTPLGRIFHSVWDWQRTGWVYGHEVQRLFQSFWGVFAWGHLALPDGYYYPLGGLAALALAGLALGLVREIRSPHNQSWERWSWGLLILALLLGWGGTVLRIHPVFTTLGNLHWPVTRYASGVIAPTALLLCLGLANILPRGWRGGAAYAGLLSIVALEIIAFWTVILPYYYG